MRVFKNAWFDKFARKEHITDGMLLDAIRRTELGLIDTDLGGGLIKQRLARLGRGKSGGCRTLVLFRTGQRAVFVFGFSKATGSLPVSAISAIAGSSSSVAIRLTNRWMR